MKQPDHRPLLLKLLAGVVLMFGFAYALVPLYDRLCKVAGVNVDPAARIRVQQVAVDATRQVRVEFIAQNNAGMPWIFKTQQVTVDVNPGRSTTVLFYAKNPTDRDMVAQAIPSITPAAASAYFKKTECFCFNRQFLAGHAEADMPLVFYIDPQLPKEIEQITLSYTLFDVTNREI